MPSEEFQAKAKEATHLPSAVTDDEKLQLYGLFKQATVGDNETPKPGLFDLKAKYKWQAWEDLKGKSQEDAEKEYISFVDSLKSKYS